MNLEYIKITPSEQSYLQKNMLENELSLLNSVKSLRKFKQLRKEELTLKVALKTKFDEILAIYGDMDRTLPKMEIPRKELEKDSQLLVEQKEELSIEEEIDAIKNKLKSLSA